MAHALERDQVRVWLDTVFLPLDEGIAVELDWLTTRDSPSYRHAGGTLERICTTQQYVGARNRRNLEQVCRWSSELKTASEEHDAACDALLAACAEAQEMLRADPAIVAIVSERPDSERGYLIEYLVNGADDLPSHYTLREVWASLQQALRAAASGPAHAERLRGVRARLADVRVRAERLRSVVDGLFDSLADEYKLPPVARAS